MEQFPHQGENQEPNMPNPWAQELTAAQEHRDSAHPIPTAPFRYESRGDSDGDGDVVSGENPVLDSAADAWLRAAEQTPNRLVPVEGPDEAETITVSEQSTDDTPEVRKEA